MTSEFAISDAQAQRIENEMDEEGESCEDCTLFQPVPHFHTHLSWDGNGYAVVNEQCLNNGRRYDPVLQKFIGKPHCSCQMEASEDTSAGANI